MKCRFRGEVAGKTIAGRRRTAEPRRLCGEAISGWKRMTGVEELQSESVEELKLASRADRGSRSLKENQGKKC